MLLEGNIKQPASHSSQLKTRRCKKLLHSGVFTGIMQPDLNEPYLLCGVYGREQGQEDA